MQSESTESSTSNTNASIVTEPVTTSQHGIPQLENLADSAPGERRDQSDSTLPNASSDGSNALPPDDAVLQLRRLSLANEDEQRAKPSYQRISEHENALAPTPVKKPYEGPGFKVVKKKGTNLDGGQLNDLPNEVLTHVLSHLPATSLSAVSLVSRRFYSLVTTPHAWRVAFSRFFPGQDAAIEIKSSVRDGSDRESREHIQSELRFFTRLTALASWRSEYILRTRLLRSLGRGKPSQIAPGHGASSRATSAANNANAVVTYSSQLFATINHIHAVFSTGKKSPRFMHGTDETGTACTSDPNIGKVDNWGLSDPQALPQFADLFIGDVPYGHGDGPTGLPNCMDLSQPFGMVYGEGFPGGQTYFRSSEEMRGRFLSQPSSLSVHEAGIPKVPSLTDATSAVWIAKSHSVPAMTDGLVGIMTGSTLGIVTAYSLGSDVSHERRVTKGAIAAKWVLSPGVPIISIKVDDSYNSTRKATGRIWAVALNALGEVYCLSRVPTSAVHDLKVAENDHEQHAWTSGRSVHWHLVEPSRRVAREDPYNEAEIHGSYSPRSSSKGMHLSKSQIIAETLEIEKFLAYRPSHFRKICKGWDMQRKLEVDFGGDDSNGAGEGIFVVSCGVLENEHPEIKRFTRWKSEQASLQEYPLPKTPPMAPKTISMASLFGGGKVITPARATSPEKSPKIIPLSGPMSVDTTTTTTYTEPGSTFHNSPISRRYSTDLIEEWRTTILSMENHKHASITATSIDMSTFALLTVDEDPLRTMSGGSVPSSPLVTPPDQGSASTFQVPGHRARYLAVGTNDGNIVLWNMRGSQPSNATMVNSLAPMRAWQTDSPEISCLALSALFLVHGGNDGLVQSWDPLASTLQPVRTLNSKYSSRARRRLVQAQASIHGVGINLYAAGAIVLDPDPTVLRGMVSLGTHLRYWSYSSSAADQYQSRKRRLRRSGERGSNTGPDRFTNTGRGALMDYIATEQEELKKEKLRKSKEEARLRGRFGVGLGGLSEEEALRYAELISAETFEKDQERRQSDAGYAADAGEVSSSQSAWSSSATATPFGSVETRAFSPSHKHDEYDQDLEEAIRLSLLDGTDSDARSPTASGSSGFGIPIKYKQKKSRRSASSSPSTSQAPEPRYGSISRSVEGSKDAVAADDLDFALQLSLAEERSRAEAADSEGNVKFPTLDSPLNDGKGKDRAF